SYRFLADAAGPTIDTSSRSVTHVYLFNRLVALTEIRMSSCGTGYSKPGRLFLVPRLFLPEAERIRKE
ncbi:MAG: hypothetical protein WB721_00825, partial [Pseudolabrys sp.]